jgi:hypothetical protein
MHYLYILTNAMKTTRKVDLFILPAWHRRLDD